MSLKLKLIDNTDEYIKELNWLRNPFGLCDWAEDNVGGEKLALWHVCNEWSYDKAELVDRFLFKQVVSEYWNKIQKLDAGYFWFDKYARRQWLNDKFNFYRSDKNYLIGALVDAERDRLGVPMSYFDTEDDIFCLGRHRWREFGILKYYKRWFSELVEFAELLQDESLKFYCSN